MTDAALAHIERPQPQGHQRPPEGDWSIWVTAGGRNSGKSFGGMHWLADYAAKHPGLRARIIAPTFGDAVASCIEGPSGLKRFAPHGKWKPSEPGGAMYDFGNGSSVWLIGTPTLNDVDRLRALGNIHCLVGDTLIALRRGLVPIRDVRAGDEALTRRGWRVVTWAGQTGVRSDLHRLTSESGSELVGTSDHRVWTDRGWVAMAFLKNSDTLTECRPLKASRTARCASPAICTTAGPDSCIESCGSKLTARSPMVGTSTTSTEFAVTTCSKTLSQCPGQTTCDCTRIDRAPLLNSERRTRTGATGGRSTRAVLRRAWSALRRSLTEALRPIGSGSARSAVRRSSATSTGPATSSRMRPAPSARPSSAPSATRRPESYLKPAPGRVRRSSPIANAEPTPVYDLTVQGEHEFFANGVLVHNCDVFEEFAANRQATAAWDQAKLSRRNPTIPNKAVIATTPRPLKLLKEWAKDPNVVYTRVSSFANKYADPAWLEEIRKLEGTRIYRQEVLGEILDDVQGALWTLADIERSRMIPAIVRYAIGVDPPSGNGTCGIAVLGSDAEQHIHVVADLSIADATPNQWAQQVIDAHDTYGGVVVCEKNQGGKMVKNTLDNVRKGAGQPPLPIKEVWASEGKRTRAEPIAVLWEVADQVAHFPGDDEAYAALTLMVDQLTSWVPPGGENPPSDFSPDRLDAAVWAAHHLRGTSPGDARVAKPTGRLGGW